jgi:DNA processing protein
MTNATAQTFSADDRLDWLRLIRSDNVGPITFYKLLERLGTAQAALKVLPDLARQGSRGSGGTKRLRVSAKADAEREMESLDQIGARLIARGEPAYPPLLARIEDAPPLISVLGNRHLLTKKAIAVVGARNA